MKIVFFFIIVTFLSACSNVENKVNLSEVCDSKEIEKQAQCEGILVKYYVSYHKHMAYKGATSTREVKKCIKHSELYNAHYQEWMSEKYVNLPKKLDSTKCGKNNITT